MIPNSTYVASRTATLRKLDYARRMLGCVYAACSASAVRVELASSALCCPPLSERLIHTTRAYDLPRIDPKRVRGHEIMQNARLGSEQQSFECCFAYAALPAIDVDLQHVSDAFYTGKASIRVDLQLVEAFLRNRQGNVATLGLVRVDDVLLERTEARQTLMEETRWDKRPEEVAQELKIWTDLLSFLFRKDQQEEQVVPFEAARSSRVSSSPSNAHSRRSRLDGLALSSSAIARLVGSVHITWPGDSRAAPLYNPSPMDSMNVDLRFWQNMAAQSKITVNHLALSGSDYRLGPLWRRLRVRQCLTLYTCTHAMRPAHWSRLEDLPTADDKLDGTGRNVALRFVQGRLDWSRRRAPQWPLNWVVHFARVQLRRRRGEVYPPFDRVRLELVGEDERSFEDFKEVLEALPEKYLDCKEFELIRREEGGNQISLEREEWASGASLYSIPEAAQAYRSHQGKREASCEDFRMPWCECDLEGGPVESYEEELEHNNWSADEMFDEENFEDAAELKDWKKAIEKVHDAFARTASRRWSEEARRRQR
ncbi:hypothetical protein IE81DRAFT_328760 [Ceraceosorus guamensis]|uniref:Uncharacterized protein n=1 Tax=Ceraceosorus guamensis TaxID=1522189 RepID=A0A316W6M0_9BASI|nr:hypothetical protein IE81DRAFT_328760 [Ceraceosorus guamensis]PWN44401.1 hypothetical protein IE81DRAFT_328760 [Ceraceosorus guamensis]